MRQNEKEINMYCVCVKFHTQKVNTMHYKPHAIKNKTSMFSQQQVYIFPLLHFLLSTLLSDIVYIIRDLLLLKNKEVTIGCFRSTEA